MSLIYKIKNEKYESDEIGDSSLIGLECDSGDFSDCLENEADQSTPFDCNGVLFFTEKTSSCGSLCDLGVKRKPRQSDNKIVRQGWTRYTRL